MLSRRIFKEPLFHFFLMGVGIFAWFWVLNPVEPTPHSTQKITVTPRHLAFMAQQFEATRKRPASPEDLIALIDAYVQEEVLVREARALGLDQGDGIIRNRLAQKMTFLTTSAAQAAEPGDAVLGAFFEENKKLYKSRERVSFEQVGLAKNADAEAAKTALMQGQYPAEHAASFLLPQGMALSVKQVVDGTFGTGFFVQIRVLKPGKWGGPVQSGYGLHLIKLIQHQPAEVPPFDRVRDRVLMDWRRARAQELTEAQLEQMRAQYEIVAPNADEIKIWLGQ